MPRIKKLPVGIEFIIEASKAPADLQRMVVISRNPLPSDARALTVTTEDFGKVIDIIVYSEEFEDVPEGMVIPTLESPEWTIVH